MKKVIIYSALILGAYLNTSLAAKRCTTVDNVSFETIRVSTLDYKLKIVPPHFSYNISADSFDPACATPYFCTIYIDNQNGQRTEIFSPSIGSRVVYYKKDVYDVIKDAANCN